MYRHAWSTSSFSMVLSPCRAPEQLPIRSTSLNQSSVALVSNLVYNSNFFCFVFFVFVGPTWLLIASRWPSRGRGGAPGTMPWGPPHGHGELPMTMGRSCGDNVPAMQGGAQLKNISKYPNRAKTDSSQTTTSNNVPAHTSITIPIHFQQRSGLNRGLALIPASP